MLRPMSKGQRPRSDLIGSRRSDLTTSSRPDSPRSEPPEIPKRPSPSVLQALRMEQMGDDRNDNSISTPSESSPVELSENVSLSEDDVEDLEDAGSDGSMNDIVNDPMYQEVDQNHESTYEPKKPPQIRIERKMFHDPRIFDSLISSSNGSEEVLNHKQGKYSRETKVAEIQPLRQNTEYSSPSNKHEQLDQFSPETPVTSELSYTPLSHSIINHSSNNVSAIATLPRTKRDKNKPPSLHLIYSGGGFPNFSSQESDSEKQPPVLEPRIIGRTVQKIQKSPTVRPGVPPWVCIHLHVCSKILS